MITGLPAELPTFQYKRQLGDMTERGLHDADEWQVRSASSAADDSETVVSSSRLANDSSLLDMDMDET